MNVEHVPPLRTAVQYVPILVPLRAPRLEYSGSAAVWEALETEEGAVGRLITSQEEVPWWPFVNI